MLWSCAGLSDHNGYGSARTLAAAYGLVFVHMGGYGMVDAVDIRTHAVRWRSAPAIGGSVSPLLHVGDTQSSISGAEHFVADGLVYVIEHVERSIRGPDKIQREYTVRVFALDALNGELKWSWSQPTEGGLSERCAARSPMAPSTWWIATPSRRCGEPARHLGVQARSERTTIGPP